MCDVNRGEVIVVVRAAASEVRAKKMAMGTSTGEIAADNTLIDRALERAAASLANDLAANAPMKRPGA